MSTDFGRDVSCTTELRTGRLVSGARLVAEAAYRRLTTRRGMLRGGEEEKNYGIDVTELVGRVDAKKVAASLPGQIRAELGKDERILGAVVTLLESRTTEGLVSFDITIDATTNAGPFQLALRVSAVTIELLKLTGGS